MQRSAHNSFAANDGPLQPGTNPLQRAEDLFETPSGYETLGRRSCLFPASVSVMIPIGSISASRIRISMMVVVGPMVAIGAVRSIIATAVRHAEPSIVAVKGGAAPT